MNMRPRKLRVAIVDDDNPEDQILAFRGLLHYILGKESVAIDSPGPLSGNEKIRAAWAFAQDVLSNEEYDLVLLDVSLEEDRFWGGTDLLVAFWPRFQKLGTRVILYSSKPAVEPPYKAFKLPGGPFQYLHRSEDAAIEAKDWGEEELSNWTRVIVQMLRDRAALVIAHASVGARRQVIENDGTILRSRGAEWDMNSLLAPFLFPLKGENLVNRQTALSLIFRIDLLGLYSYWFKAQSFHWPVTNMYGLTWLDEMQSGSLDGATHLDRGFQGLLRAAWAAKSDLEVVRMCLDDDSRTRIEEWINKIISGHHPELSEIEDFVTMFRFRWKDVVEELKCGRIERPTGRIWELQAEDDDKPTRLPYYCGTINGTPRMILGARMLGQSVQENCEAGQWGVKVHAEEPLTGVSASLVHCPELWLVVGMNGRRNFETSEDVRVAFSSCGHSLARAFDAIGQFGEWYVVRSGDRVRWAYSVADHAELPVEVASSLWSRFVKSEGWPLVHLLRFRVPVSRRGN